MRATGIVRRIDDLGRIVIPKEIRRQIFDTSDASGEPMEIFMDGNDIVLRRYETAEMRKEKEIRAKAIDEFSEVLLNQDVVDKSVIRRVKEQLKGGAE